MRWQWMGIRPEEFWKMGPKELEPYLKAHKLREKQKIEQVNFQGWLTGLYVSHAIGSVLSEISKYPEKPIDLFGDEISEEERLRMDAELFAAYADEYNKQMKKEVDEVVKGE